MAEYQHVTDPDKIRKMIANEQILLKQFEDWKKAGKPCDVWWHRSSGVWSRNTIKALKIKLSELS